MRLSEALGIEKDRVITCVGAGGKSSLLITLANELRDEGRKFLLTTTTKMYYEQVSSFAPVFCSDYDRGIEHLGKRVEKYHYAGWFRRYVGLKALGLPTDWVDNIYRARLVSNILVEGDGARRKLIKAPDCHEPAVPSTSDLVIGVLSLKAIGQILSSSIAHRLEIVSDILDKKPGEVIEPLDLAILAGHERGIFQNVPGEKIVVLTGGEPGNCCAIAEEVAARLKSMKKTNLKSSNIMRIVVTNGFGDRMKPLGQFI